MHKCGNESISIMSPLTPRGRKDTAMINNPPMSSFFCGSARARVSAKFIPVHSVIFLPTSSSVWLVSSFPKWTRKTWFLIVHWLVTQVRTISESFLLHCRQEVFAAFHMLWYCFARFFVLTSTHEHGCSQEKSRIKRDEWRLCCQGNRKMNKILLHTFLPTYLTTHIHKQTHTLSHT